MNLNHLHTLDRIAMDQQSYQKIILWYQNLKETPETLDIPFHEGILMMKMHSISEEELNKFADQAEYKDKVNAIGKKELVEDALQKEIHTYFNLGDGQHITCTQLEYDKATGSYDPIITFTCNAQTFEETKLFDVKSHLKHAHISNEELQKLAIQAFHTVMQTLHFISNYQEGLTIKEHRVIKAKKGKAKGGKPGKKRVVQVGVKTYHFQEQNTSTSSTYNRHTDSWRVRGHWRYYPKTGKRVWIEPYTKGDGNIEGKEYRV